MNDTLVLSFSEFGRRVTQNGSGDVHYESDFRSVYAKVIDNWLGGDSVGVLGGNFRKSGLEFV